MDRAPLPPPFAKGVRLRYVGTREVYAIASDETRIPYIAPGLEVTISATRPGYRGTLASLPGDWDEDGPPLDTTQDGYSVYEVEIPGDKKPFGRIVWPADAHEWQAVP